ncbi:MAG: TetR/AcrR family transcriptional regulator [Candidatus Lokiarchaeota archaeon]|nr:TetR/AcrR family transcriptional regulator [Candidatus Lokiarchaeota archaeon]
MSKLTRREREKKVRKNEMILAAEKLFSEKNYNEVTMNEIAKESEFTKRTLYQYFPSKEDIYFAVTLEGFKNLYNYCQKALSKGDTGFNKIYHVCLAYYDFYKNNPKIFKLMTYIGYVKRNRGKSISYKEFRKFDTFMFNQLSELIKIGQKDGTIRPNIDPKKTTYTLIFLITGFFQQLSQSGESFTEFISMSEKVFTEFSLDLLLSSISIL